MIHLTRLNRVPLVLNSDLIEQLEVTPDTVITLTNGEKIMVLEPAEEVVRRVVSFRRLISSPGGLGSRACDTEEEAGDRIRKV